MDKVFVSKPETSIWIISTYLTPDVEIPHRDPLTHHICTGAERNGGDNIYVEKQF